ncbi:hypothetical protein [Pseudomonas sp. UBA2684]|uniref:hypothetical protein n=1 Tax=Pseudomonas sp. UBA2684 TaxID=1947311 RepID=UPI000E99854C|nr:hypothetical protein [Pseudomonas sp. UBA2684]HBX56075.1 hypothetical protein [Pseudomonas sp.]|tara:strand:+ start:295 stop:897 length:603 start_codon:yes stop_codon:yes gene_type:complete
MGVVDWMKHHWKGGATFVLATTAAAIITKIVDQRFDLGWFAVTPDLVANIYRQLTGWLAFQVSLPVWLLLPVLAAVVFITLRLRGDRSQLTQSLTEAMTELEGLKQPKTPAVPVLNADQQIVLQTIAAEIEKQRGFPCFADLKRGTGFSHLVTEGATDVLIDAGLIRWDWDRMDIMRANLTPAGRAYLLSTGISDSQPHG